MIRLTLANTGRPFFVAADAIYSAGDYQRPDGLRNYVCYEGDGGDGTEIVESATDVARLRAAWEQRFNASELRGSLPIAVYMDGSEETRSIQFMCCALSHALRQKKLAQREHASLKARLGRFLAQVWS